MGLTETDRFRAIGFIRAFLADLKACQNSKALIFELNDDTYPELRIIQSEGNKPLTPANVVGSAAVVKTCEQDYTVFCTGGLQGCKLLSSAIERTRDILKEGV